MPSSEELMRGFTFGPWQVIPERGLLRDGETETRLEPLVMDVFVSLASHGGEVVTKDQLIAEVWQGRPQMDDVITRCISALRRGLDDDARHPKYIETVQRRGYRVMLPAEPMHAHTEPAQPEPVQASIRPDLIMIAVGFVAVATIAWYALSRWSPPAMELPATVAVFPFECLQDASAPSEHLCFGFAEEAISSLKQIDGIQVVRKRTNYDPGLTIGEDSIVTGSVQIIADDVRIAARLEDPRTGLVRWSHTFDAGRNGIFDIQRRVADGLRAALDTDFRPETGGKPLNFAAAEAYALGRYFFEKRDHGSIVEAIGHFEDTIEMAPSYGPAWLGLAYTYSIWPDYDLSIDRDATFARALEIMQQGVAADPSIREAAGTVFGYIYHKQNRWAEAMANTSIAVGAEAPSADDYHWHSRVLASVGRLDESLDFARRGAELDPDYPAIVSRLAISYFWVNDLDNAEKYFRIANRMDFEASIHSLAYALFLIRTNRIEDAKLRAKQALEKFNLNSAWVDPVFDGIASPEKHDEALATLRGLERSGQVPDNVLMTAAMLLGDADMAMRVARGADDDSSVFEYEIIYIDEYRDFRRHPGFGAFAEAAGLDAYWRNAGCTWRADRVECG